MLSHRIGDSLSIKQPNFFQSGVKFYTPISNFSFSKSSWIFSVVVIYFPILWVYASEDLFQVQTTGLQYPHMTELSGISCRRRSLIPFWEIHPHGLMTSQRPFLQIPSHWSFGLNIRMRGDKHLVYNTLRGAGKKKEIHPKSGGTLEAFCSSWSVLICEFFLPLKSLPYSYIIWNRS